MLALTWADDREGKSAFWLHAAVQRGIRPSVDDQLGTTPRASPDSSGYISRNLGLDMRAVKRPELDDPAPSRVAMAAGEVFPSDRRR